jgi:cell cycle arrest protein BUB2
MVVRQRLAVSRTSAAADAVSLERLLRDGPPDSDVPAALESARLKVLDQGIKSDGDGMVSLQRWEFFCCRWEPWLTDGVVVSSYLRLAHLPQCAGPRD